MVFILANSYNCNFAITAFGGERMRNTKNVARNGTSPSARHHRQETGNQAMKILEIREVTAPIASPIANAYIDFSKMTLSLVAVVTDVVRDGRRVVGYGFNSNGRYGQGGLIRERFAPRILEADPASLLDDAGENLDPDRVWAAMMKNEKPGGHGERSVAVGTIDMAVWDAVAKIAGEPLFRLLAKRHGREANPRVFVYAAGGYYYPGKGLDELRGEMRGYLDRGYTVVKMKIGNGVAEDQPRIEAVLKELDGKAQLAVDANGRLTLEQGVAYAKMLREYPLFWYEEVGDPLDFALQATLAEFYPGPMATGENLFSHQDARNLLRYGGLRPDRDWLQFDCALSYGLCEYQRTLEVLRVAGWSPSRCIPHGGHQMSLNIAAGLGLGGNESYPDLFQPYGGFPDGVRVEDGHILMPDLPGIGFEGKSDLIKVMRAFAE
jgi:D(-)-tartrate dehydratase